MSNRPRKQPAALRSTAASRAQEKARALERERTRKARMWGWIGGGIAVVVLAVGVVAFAMTRPKSEPVKPSKDALALGCASCHTVDGSRAEGPTWKGLYGSTVTLSDGRTVTVDDAYIRRAIRDPQADVAPGYPTAMPTIDVTDAELDRLVAYIKGLSD